MSNPHHFFEKMLNDYVKNELVSPGLFIKWLPKRVYRKKWHEKLHRCLPFLPIPYKLKQPVIPFKQVEIPRSGDE